MNSCASAALAKKKHRTIDGAMNVAYGRDSCNTDSQNVKFCAFGLSFSSHGFMHSILNPDHHLPRFCMV